MLTPPAIAALAVIVLDATSSAAASPPDPGPAGRSSVASVPSPTTSPEADVVVGSEDFDQTVIARAGQRFQVKRAADLPEWEVEFDAARAPGPEGWLFRAKASGRTEFAATAASSCPEGSTCPPAALRFHVTFDIQP